MNSLLDFQIRSKIDFLPVYDRLKGLFSFIHQQATLDLNNSTYAGIWVSPETAVPFAVSYGELKELPNTVNRNYPLSFLSVCLCETVGHRCAPEIATLCIHQPADARGGRYGGQETIL